MRTAPGQRAPVGGGAVPAALVPLLAPALVACCSCCCRWSRCSSGRRGAGMARILRGRQPGRPGAAAVAANVRRAATAISLRARRAAGLGAGPVAASRARAAAGAGHACRWCCRRSSAASRCCSPSAATGSSGSTSTSGSASRCRSRRPAVIVAETFVAMPFLVVTVEGALRSARPGPRGGRRHARRRPADRRSGGSRCR